MCGSFPPSNWVSGLCVCFQIDISETWPLRRTSLPSTWLKVYSNIYQKWLVKSACFCTFQAVHDICSSSSSPKCGDENARMSFWKNNLFPWFGFDFFGAILIRSFQNIYFGFISLISSCVFWCKCRHFSADVSLEFGWVKNFKNTFESCLQMQVYESLL